MSKKRRTRHEKIVSQERQKHLITQTPSGEAVYSFASSEPINKSETPISLQNRQSYTYVLQDMKRSITITSILILISSVLSILIQNQIINLRNFGY